MRFLKCGRCGRKTAFGLGSHELHQFEVCGECFSELDAMLEEQEEERERELAEEERDAS